MPDRFLCLLFAAALVLAGQPQGMGQGMAPRSGIASPRAEAENPSAGAVGASPMYLPSAPMERQGALVDPTHRLQQGDELSFKIEQDKEPAIPLLVSHTGEVVVEPLEHAVKVAGLTTAQAAAELKRELEKDYYYTATVRLSLTAVNRVATMGYIYLDGAIAKLGALPVYADRPIKLSEAILTAGGFARYAEDRKVKVTRMRNGTPETLVSDMKAVMKGGQLDKDIVLQDGDRVFVPTRFFQY